MYVFAVIAVLLLMTAFFFPLRLQLTFEGTAEKISLVGKFFRWQKKIKKELDFFKRKKQDLQEEKKDLKNQKSKKIKNKKKQPINQSETHEATCAREPQDKLKLNESVYKDKKTKEENLKTENINSPEKVTDIQFNENTQSESSINQEENNQKNDQEKKTISERDFFSILLQPIFVSRVWKTVCVVFKRFCYLFQVKFYDSYVAGVGCSDPAKTGFLAACVAVFFGVFPILKGWRVEWDWCRNTSFFIKANCVLKINLFRIFAFLAVVFVYALWLFLSYRLLRRKYLKNPDSMSLSLWRKKIVNFLAEE